MRDATFSQSSDEGRDIVDRIRGGGVSCVEALAFFHGVPIFQAADILEIDVPGRRLRMKVHGYHIHAIRWSPRVYFRCAALEKPVVAHSDSEDDVSCTAWLSGMYYAESFPDQRESIRIEPAERMTAEVTLCGKTVTGLVEDISIKGVSLVVPFSGGDAAPEEAEIAIRLPATATRKSFVIKASGRVAKHHVMATKARLVLVLAPDASVETDLSQYVFHRQAEIIGELRALAAEAR